MNFPPTRRTFLVALGLVPFASLTALADTTVPKKILLRSSWQTVNIGDIAHTPGVLHLLEQHLPEVEVQLWPGNVDNGVEPMLLKRFPKLKIVKTPEQIKAAFAECDFLLHGSGPSMVASKHVAKWSKETGKPYGIYGITLGAADDELKSLITGAKFAFFRDSVSLEFAKSVGITCPIMEFGPDGAFAVDLRNDEAAKAFLAANGLVEGKFLCCIPRLRKTPYWKIHGKPMTDEDQRSHVRNEAMKEHDHAKLREAIIAITNETEMKVLICPEDRSQMEIGKEMLFDKLPEKTKAKVVWREQYWLTDEALSTYVRSAGLFGNEMHSPIMCVGNGIPAVVCRWKEQTSKGFMWKDIELGEWLFDLDNEAELDGIVPAVLSIAKDPRGSKAKAAKANEVVKQRQQATMAILRKTMGL